MWLSLFLGLQNFSLRYRDLSSVKGDASDRAPFNNLHVRWEIILHEYPSFFFLQLGGWWWKRVPVLVVLSGEFTAKHADECKDRVLVNISKHPANVMYFVIELLARTTVRFPRSLSYYCFKFRRALLWMSLFRSASLGLSLHCSVRVTDQPWHPWLDSTAKYLKLGLGPRRVGPLQQSSMLLKLQRLPEKRRRQSCINLQNRE